MAEPIHIGINIGYNEPYWIMVSESLYSHAMDLPVKLIAFDIDQTRVWGYTDVEQIVEEMVGQKLGALISWSMPNSVTERVLAANIPIVLFAEAKIKHPSLLSLANLYDAGRLVMRHVAKKLHYQGNILVIDGTSFPDGNYDGRYNGFTDAARPFPKIQLIRVSAPYPPYDPLPFLEASFLEIDRRINALIGSSDDLTLKARTVAEKMGMIGPGTLVAGIGSDPLALDAVANGTMEATVELVSPRLCQQLLEVTYQAALGVPLPEHILFSPTLVTAENVNRFIMEKFVTFSSLPSRMIGLNREQQKRHSQQLETGLQTIRQISSMLDHRQILHEVVTLIREKYGYEKAYVYLFSKEKYALVWENPLIDRQEQMQVSLREGGLLGQVYVSGEVSFIQDAQHSIRYEFDPAFPNTRSRIVLPIRMGDEILGVLDLHSYRLIEHDKENALSLQLVADQIGIALRNATLYENAVQAQAKAEEADNLKTRLLANVSHELRTPLNLIMSYSQMALTGPDVDNARLPSTLRNDLGHIYSSATHLLRLINDLLDLSRAEIDELQLYPETISPRPILEDAFTTMKMDLDLSEQVEWRLELPERLPLIQVDPVRFRQILYNLLSNAAKFTEKGHITLGARVELPNLHIWVEDTGIGIPPNLKERIFEPFAASVMPARRRDEGIGLGLAITRRFVALHDGTISLDSTPGKGSVFRVYLPLPNLFGKPAIPSDDRRQTMLVISTQATCPEAILEIATRQGLEVLCMQPADDIERVLERTYPMSVAWDLSQVGPGDWELVESIRKHAQVGKLPFIMFSADSNVASIKGAQRAEMTGVAVKPLSARTLHDLIEALRPARTHGTVLIVDDDPPTCESYRRVVQKALPGYEVHCIYSGEQAIEWLSLNTPVLVILDLMMPGVSGFEVLDSIRSNLRTQHAPVLVISGHVLSAEHIKRLDHSNVTLQFKDILSENEMAQVFSQTLSGKRTLPQSTSAVVKKVLSYIQANYSRPITRQEIAHAIGVGETYLSSIFHQEFGIGLWDYLNRMRINTAKRLLSETDKPVDQIAEEVGFRDSAYFSRIFHKQTGISPREYRNKPRV